MEVNKIYNGNCLEVLKTFPDNSIDSCVTDPPYGINFMNKHWDYDVPKVEVWQEIYRVLKPGGYILCACGTRTQHRMAVNIEDAGFEIRDVITWHYGSGFPKSMDISKAIDKAAGAEREVTGVKPGHEGFANRGNLSSVQSLKGTMGGEGGFARPWMDNPEAVERYHQSTAPSTDAAKQWEGWGTALKPATEFWTLARKPLSEKTVAENVLKYGTGGINIDVSRIVLQDGDDKILGGAGDWSTKNAGWVVSENSERGRVESSPLGRFPANVIFDEFTGKILDEQSGITQSKSGDPTRGTYNKAMFANSEFNKVGAEYDDIGGSSRFFYCPKADNYERNKGLKGFEVKQSVGGGGGIGDYLDDVNSASGKYGSEKAPKKNHHPTVKPIDLMRYLVKLITPKKGICLDPYCGSGTTLIGCKMELINYIGIEREGEYCKIAEARVASWNPDKYKPQELF